MATVEPYNLCWPVGEDAMLLVSIGTSTSAAANAELREDQMNLLYNAKRSISPAFCDRLAR